MSNQRVIKFQNTVWEHYRTHGRHHLPWRKTTDPYKILVSEVMLQQTQVDRVIPFYKAFLKRFPTVSALAKAPLSEVLIAWQGLGYNRRAKMLHEAAKAAVKEHAGKLPKGKDALVRLPGIGPYTAGAVSAFAFNEDGLFIETNIRTVLTHHFFPKKEQVIDRDILAILQKTFPKGNARAWYSALMDYGSHLKRSGIRINAKSKHYTKQKAFKGSDREVRGMILRTLAKGPRTKRALMRLAPLERKMQFEQQLHRLSSEGFVVKKNLSYQLPT